MKNSIIYVISKIKGFIYPAALYDDSHLLHGCRRARQLTTYINSLEPILVLVRGAPLRRLGRWYTTIPSNPAKGRRHPDGRA